MENIVFYMDEPRMKDYLRGMEKMEMDFAKEKERLSGLVGFFDECIMAASLPGQKDDPASGGSVNTDKGFSVLARAYQLQQRQIEEYIKGSVILFLHEEKLKLVRRCILMLPDRWGQALAGIYVHGIPEDEYAAADKAGPAHLREDLRAAMRELLTLYNSRAYWLGSEARYLRERYLSQYCPQGEATA